jgi:hypothetical protein
MVTKEWRKSLRRAALSIARLIMLEHSVRNSKRTLAFATGEGRAAHDV